MANTTYLITGGNRGIGKGLVALYLARPSNTVVVSVRDPQHPTSLALRDLPVGEGSSLIITTIEFADNASIASGIAELQSKHNITSLDIVIANAGLSTVYPKVLEAKLEDFIPHYQVNVIGVVALFQAVFPLLEKGKKPMFITLGSSAGYLGDMNPFPNAVYGPTKTALHYITKRIHQEHDNLIAFPVDPGWVQTDMGNRGANLFGLKEAAIDVNTSVTGIVKIIDAATKETHSGRLWEYTGEVHEW